MRAFKLMLPAVLLTAGFLVCTTASYGTAEYAKKEKKGCNFCHSKVAPADKEAHEEEPDGRRQVLPVARPLPRPAYTAEKK